MSNGLRARTRAALSHSLLALAVPVLALFLVALATGSAMLMGVATGVTLGWVVAAMLVTRGRPEDDLVIDLRTRKVTIGNDVDLRSGPGA